MKTEIENEIMTLKNKILEREQQKFKKKVSQLTCKSFNTYLPKVLTEATLLEK